MKSSNDTLTPFFRSMLDTQELKKLFKQIIESKVNDGIYLFDLNLIVETLSEVGIKASHSRFKFTLNVLEITYNEYIAELIDEAKKDNFIASTKLGKMYKELGNRHEKGIGVNKNENVAAELYQDAAKLFKDNKSKVDCYTRAALLGNAIAQNELAICFGDGTGVDINEKAAVFWYEMAANNGLVEAQYNLGLCFEEGCGVQKNEKMAQELFIKAANNGYYDAIKRLENYGSSNVKPNTITQSEEVKKDILSQMGNMEDEFEPGSGLIRLC